MQTSSSQAVRALLLSIPLLLPACAMGVDSDVEDATQGEAAVGDDSCIIARTTGDTSRGPTATFYGNEREARRGQRLTLVAVDASGAGQFEPTIVGAGQVLGTTGVLGDLKFVQVVVPADGRYHFEVHDVQGRARVFRATLDVLHDSPSCLTMRPCYRAVGPGCGGVSVVAPAEFLGDGTRRLWVTPGSQLHDSCCTGHPNGVHCGGNESDGACQAEWNRAWYDSKNGATWWHVFDPTQLEYAIDRSAETTGQYSYLGTPIATGRPRSYWGWLPPGGGWVNQNDAAAWCPNGPNGETSVTGYARCKF